MQADIPLPGEELPQDDAADQDSRIRSDVEESEEEVMQGGQQADEEEEEGEDLMENMAGCVVVSATNIESTGRESPPLCK